jgi:outer membrane protein insertion porin family
MAAAADQNPKEAEPRKPSNEAEVAEEEYDEDYEDDDEELEERDASKVSAAEREKIQAVFQRLSSEEVGIRVHDVLIKGNTKTRDELIEAEVVDLLRAAPTVQALLRAASVATARLQQLDVFDAIKITLDAGPPELPGTTNVVIEVVEAANPVTGTAGVYSKPEVNPSLFVRCMSIACDVELLVAEDIEQCLSFLLDMD